MAEKFSALSSVLNKLAVSLVGGKSGIIAFYTSVLVWIHLCLSPKS